VAVGEALGNGAPVGFARAEAPRAFTFPGDHGPHPEFRNEWWYLTGNLLTPEGERFGFQVTFFRIGLTAEAPQRTSRWATDQVWMAHAALTDVRAGEHTPTERFARQALDLAGAQAEPFAVWLGNWRLESAPDHQGWMLRVHTETFDLDLALTAEKPVILQGYAGLSQKSAEPGNASYYYSLPRLRTRGQIRSHERTQRVEGWSWLDREWSTSALGPDQTGWDWFALHLNDGRDLMFYRLRRSDGSLDPHSAGSLVEADGTAQRIGPEDLVLRPLSWWSSADHRYPIAWELEVKPWQRTLRVQAYLEDQLMDLSVRYWEGAVEVIDPATGAAIGSGYLELAGY
jgi:predicted secreted hydrolase